MTRTRQLLAALLSIALVASVGLVVTGGFAGAQTQQGSASVTIEDQPSDGETVIVDSVTLPEGGFVVIHDTEALEDGQVVDSVIGVSTYLEAGTHEDVPVTMGQELDTTEVEVTAMAHMDTNGNEVYDFVTSEGELDGAYTTGAAGTETPAATETPAVATPTETEMTETETGTEVTETETTETETTETETEMGAATTTTEGDFQQVTETPEDGTPTETEETETPMTETETPAVGMPTETPGVTTTPAEDGAGQPVVDTATIDAVGDGAPATNLEFSNQSSDGTTVTVDRVTLYRGGYVVIHDAAELEDGDAVGSVIGHSGYLPPGTYEDVQVTLADPLEVENGSVNVTAMPHFETQGNLVFDFAISMGTEDEPYTANDTPVTATAAVSAGDGNATETATETETATPMTPTETPEVGTPTETETEIGTETEMGNAAETEMGATTTTTEGA